MLQLRPSCEQCNTPLPPESREAMICTYECTFCQDCVGILENVCPNCGGGFCPRPQRPAKNLRNGNYLGNHPATSASVFKPVDLATHRAFAKPIKSIPADQR